MTPLGTSGVFAIDEPDGGGLDDGNSDWTTTRCRQLFLEARTHRAWLPREVPDSRAARSWST